MTTLSPFLRNALVLDAAVSTLAAITMIGGAGILAEPLGLPSELLFWAGVACVPFVALIVLALRARTAPPALVATIIAINFAWVAGSLFVAFGPMLKPTLLGQIFACAQAAAVLLFADLQVIGLRRRDRAAA